MLHRNMINKNSCLAPRIVSTKRAIADAKRQSIQFSHMNLIGAMLQMPVDEVPAIIKRASNLER